jgi:hypothetical protein
VSKEDDKRHRYALMMSAHRDEWIAFGRKHFGEQFDKDRARVRSIFAATSSPKEAEDRVKSYLKGPARVGWQDKLKTVWGETGKATITYMHAFLTGKNLNALIQAAYTGQQLKQSVDEEAAQASWTDAVNEKIKTSFVGKIKDITKETADTIHNTIADGVINGDSHLEIGNAVDNKLIDSFIGRGERISRTEANSSMNFASLKDALFAAPDLDKVWSTTGMDNVREWHQDADGQRRSQDEPFDVMDEQLDYPGDDVNGSGANIINCACCMFFEPSE